MKMLLATIALLVSTTCLHAADPQGFALWKGSMVKNAGKELATKMDAEKFAWLPMATYSNHLIGISHRERSGGAELHQTQADIFVVEGGKAQLVVGGTIVAPKTVKPHEIRGTSIEGGITKQLAPGDIVHIPANVPHQLKIAPGTAFTYLVIKVDSN
jgi:mannose-6-phosphate isomerase-like protein (cupin superfamily)